MANTAPLNPGPFVVHNITWVEESVANEDVKGRKTFLQANLQPSQGQQKMKSGRCQVYFDSMDVMNKLTTFVSGQNSGRIAMTPQLAGQAGEHGPAVSKAFTRPSVCGARPGSEVIGTETGEAGSVRVVFEGSMRVAAFSVPNMLDFLRTRGIVASGQDVSYDMLVNAVSQFTEELLSIAS